MTKTAAIVAYLREGSESGRPTQGETEAADLIESMERALELCFEEIEGAYRRGYRDGQSDLVSLTTKVAEASHRDRIDREMLNVRRLVMDESSEA